MDSKRLGRLLRTGSTSFKNAVRPKRKHHANARRNWAAPLRTKRAKMKEVRKSLRALAEKRKKI